MKTELKRLLEKAENVYLSQVKDIKTNGWLVVTLPEEERKTLEQLAEDLSDTFSVPVTINVELSKDNLYNLDFTIDEDSCTIGQVPIDNTSVAGFREASPIQLLVRVPEKVVVTIDDLTEDDTLANKANIPSFGVECEGEITITGV